MYIQTPAAAAPTNIQIPQHVCPVCGQNHWTNANFQVNWWYQNAPIPYVAVQQVMI